MQPSCVDVEIPTEIPAAIFHMILRITLLLSTVLISSFALRLRFKRDFMYVADGNGTDTDCYQKCNEKHKHDFEFSLNMSAADFYDFPLHPLVLQHSSYLLYCKLADQRTKCYQNECGDMSADTVFSPSNFLCNFKRSHFSETRPCLADAEPITFLKCDHQCHERLSKERPADQLFSADSLDGYENELDQLCSFQGCYMSCMEPVVMEVCSRSIASSAVSLVKTLVEWHAADVADWHAVTGREHQLPESCRRLSGSHTDPILQIISRA